MRGGKTVTVVVLVLAALRAAMLVRWIRNNYGGIR
jgi:hypothetical protein